MEPMALGSPTHSPSGSPGTSFLPPFLVGDFNQPTSPRTGSLSPTKGRTLAFGNSPPARPSPQIPHYSTPLLQKGANNVSFSNKANGPPTQGLFDSLNQSDWNNRNVQSPPNQYTSPSQHQNFYQQQENNFGYSENQHVLMNQSQNQSLRNMSYSHHPSEAQASILSNNDSYYNGLNEEQIDHVDGSVNEYWITVFGFPPSAANMILTQFSNCGSIAEKKFPAQGNWVWLRFTSRTEASRALALNGRILSGLMVGVLPCSQPPSQHNPQFIKGGARQLAVGPPRLQNISATSPTTTTAPGAQRSSGAISRALEYVFGW